MDKKAVVAAIRTAKTRAGVDDIFSKFNIDDQQEKIAILIDAMYNPEFFFSNEVPSLDQKYELTVEMFLDGEWRLIPAFDVMEKI